MENTANRGTISITLLFGWVVALEPGLDPERKSAGPGLRTQGAPCVPGSVTKRYVGHPGRHLRSPRPSGHSGSGDPAQAPPQAPARGPRGPGEAARSAPARPFPLPATSWFAEGAGVAAGGPGRRN